VKVHVDLELAVHEHIVPAWIRGVGILDGQVPHIAHVQSGQQDMGAAGQIDVAIAQPALVVGPVNRGGLDREVPRREVTRARQSS
jgi:hypothetical protein